MSDSTESRLTIFSEAACDLLVSYARSTTSIEEWLAVLEEEGTNSTNLLHVSRAFGSTRPELSPLAKDDATSAAQLYTYLGKMQPHEAADRRLWNYLTCVKFREYTSRRWPLIEPKWHNRLDDRWVLATSSRARLARNAVARLWWAAYLTEDHGFDHEFSRSTRDPFAYTKFLLSNQDQTVGFVEREQGTRGDALFLALDVLHAHSSHGPSELFVREFLKELNLVAAFQDQSMLSRDELLAATTEAADRAEARAKQ